MTDAFVLQSEPPTSPEEVSEQPAVCSALHPRSLPDSKSCLKLEGPESSVTVFCAEMLVSESHGTTTWKLVASYLLF